MDTPPKPSKIHLVVFGVCLAALIAGYLFLSLFFTSKIQDLGQRNEALQAKSKDLEKTLEQVRSENKTLVEKLQGEKKDLKDEIESVKKDNEALRLDLSKIEMQYKNAAADKHSLEEMLVNKTREAEELKTRPGAPAIPATTFAPNTPEDVVQKIQEKDSEIRNLSEQNKILSDKLEKLYKTMNEKITQISIAKIALEQTVAEARSKISEEWNTVNLGSINVEKKAGSILTPAADDSAAKPAPSGPKKEGKVLAVNEEQGFVVVDLGKVDNINPESKLIVRHDGKYVATLSILEIRDVMSACHIKILPEGQKIQVNDSVTLRR